MKNEIENLNKQEKAWVDPFKEFLTELSEPKREGIVDDVPFLSPIDRDDDYYENNDFCDEQPEDIFNA